jgi:heat shock protein HslJ
MIMKNLQILFLGCLLLFITACGTVTKINPISLLTGNTWTLYSLTNSELSLGDFSSGLPTLNFLEGGRLAGFTGCNNFSGGFSLENSGIQLDPGALTKKICPGMSEEGYLDILGKVNTYTVEKGKLTLLDGASELMSFIPKKE